MRIKYHSCLTMIILDKANLLCVSAEFKICPLVPSQKLGSHVSQVWATPHFLSCPPCQLLTQATFFQVAEVPKLSANGNLLVFSTGSWENCVGSSELGKENQFLRHFLYVELFVEAMVELSLKISKCFFGGLWSHLPLGNGFGVCLKQYGRVTVVWLKGGFLVDAIQISLWS